MFRVTAAREELRSRATLVRVMAVTAAVVCVLHFQEFSVAVANPKADLHAVVVGVTQFQDRSIRPLKLAARDARDFVCFLEERKDYFNRVHMTMLLDQEATRANVVDALRERLKKARENDIVILYFSGHGVADTENPGEFYFVTHDAQAGNLFGTALLMSDPKLFRAIRTERLLMITDACHAAGFIPGVEKVSSKAIAPRFAIFEGLNGRKVLASSRGDELSYEEDRFGNSIFTHFLLKGLRGEADAKSRDGSVTIEELYQYVYENTKAVTAGKQNPQMYPIIKQGDRTPIFAVPTFKDALNVDVSFQYVDENNEVRPLTDGADLRSGSLVGVSFRPESDCFVYIMWRDSSGQMGRLFPNPELTEGNVVAKAGKNYWLPMKGGEEAQDRWYMLDDAPGEETIYFVASRERNPKLEQLYESLTRLGDSQRRGAEGKDLTREMEREMNLMGFASQTATRKKAVSPRQDDAEKRFEDLKNKIEVAGADLVYAVKFKHLADRTASR